MSKQPFIPPKLPPKIDYASLIRELGQAHSSLGQLNGLLASIANPDLLTTPLLTKEAVLSSRIEGTQATLEDVFKYEAEEKSSQASAIEADVREILNYRQAIKKAIDELKRKPISENLIKKVHFVLLDSVRGAKKDRGNLRRLQVFIGKAGATIEQASFIPPPAGELPRLLGEWEKYVNSDKEPDQLVQIGLAHYQFEAIHPFMDGNGRIGRLLIPLFLFENKLLNYPLLYISEHFEKNRTKYYQLLNRVSVESDWESWIKFFLEAITLQSNKTQNTIKNILNLYKELKNNPNIVTSVSAYRLLDIVFTTPFVSYMSIKKHLDVKSNQTVYNLLSSFVDAKILYEIPDKKRGKIYVFKRLVDILK